MNEPLTENTKVGMTLLKFATLLVFITGTACGSTWSVFRYLQSIKDYNDQRFTAIERKIDQAAWTAGGDRFTASDYNTAVWLSTQKHPPSMPYSGEIQAYILSHGKEAQ